jgi:transcriptional regulator with XRE-family HTH domain
MMKHMHEVTAPVSQQIAAKLAELQGRRTDEEFAALLGVTRTHWSHIRSGRRKASYALVKRAAALFPELYPIVMRDLVAVPTEAAS